MSESPQKAIIDAGIYHTIQSQADTYPIDEVVRFVYKNREATGKALHVAAMYPDGTPTVEALLRRRANPREQCHSVSYGSTQIMEPMHLAAGKGSAKTMMLLLERRALVDAKVLHGDKEHYSALHEAAFHGNLSTARFLLENGATVNCVNMMQQTPLHVAAKSGAWPVASALVNIRANLSLRDYGGTENPTGGKTALAYAIMSRFPDSKLSILSEKTLGDLMMVANMNPRAAKVLLNLDDVPEEMAEWRKGFLKDGPPSWKDLQVLIRTSPVVAASVLKILTVQPSVEHEYAHPLPKVLPRDSIRSKTLNCEYQSDEVWTFKSEKSGENFPAWHNKLAPIQFNHDGKATRQSSQSVVDTTSLFRHIITWVGRLIEDINEYWLKVPRGRTAVQIRMLKIPNIVQVEVLNALSDAAADSIFGSTAAQAIVDYCWTGVARMHYNVHFIFRACELFILLRVALVEPDDVTDIEKRALWSFLCCSSVREMGIEFMQALGYIRAIGDFGAYFFNAWNYLDFVSIAILATLVWKSLSEDDLIFTRVHPALLATVAFFRWVQMLYMLRAYAFYDLGYKIIPIFMSFFRAGEIFVISFGFFLAFTHAFCVINGDSNSNTEVFLNTFRLLFLSDGDGINYVLNLGGEETNFNRFVLYVAGVGFCICILNLFIAVHGSAYDHENNQIMAKENFYLHRARVCLSAMLQPGYPFQWPPNPHRWYIGWMVCGISAWFGLLYIPDQKVAVVVAAVVLYFFALVGDRCCRGKQLKLASVSPGATSENFLWWVEVLGQDDDKLDDAHGDVDALRAAEAAEEAENEIDVLTKQVEKLLESMSAMSSDMTFVKQKLCDIEKNTSVTTLP